MEFLDNNHRIFSLPSFKEKPIGYQYNTQPYVFWVDSDKQSYLSINNFYIKTIYCLIDLTNYGIDMFLANISQILDTDTFNVRNAIDYWFNNSAVPSIYTSESEFFMTEYLPKNKFEITVELESNVYKLLNTEYISNALNNIDDINEKIDLIFDSDSVNVYDSLSSSNTDADGNSDILTIITHENGSYYAVMPIYVICKCEDEGAWISNIMIHVKNEEYNNDVVVNTYEEWCPISIGGEFQKLYEELVVNGKNYGVTLPRDILKSIYIESFVDSEFNEELYNEKIKEYLLNFMEIKANQGNVESVINSLNWFGWGNKLSLTTLFNINDSARHAYFLTNFNIFDNLFLYSYQRFTKSSFVKLHCNINTEYLNEDGEIQYYPQDLPESENDDVRLFGENNPMLIDLNDSYMFVENYDGISSYTLDNIKYVKKFYDFTFNELALKLLLVKYYMNKYFLPVHMLIKTSALQYKVYANDVKFINNTTYNIQEDVISTEDTNVSVTFKNRHTYIFNKQTHIVDACLNEFDRYYNNSVNDFYLMQETCINIPITFNNIVDEDGNSVPTYFNCVLLLEKENEINDNYKYVYYTQFDSVENLFNVTDNIFIVDNTTNKIYYDLDNNKNYIFGYNVNTLDANNAHNIHIYYDSYKELQENMLNNKTYQHNLSSISLNESIFETSIIDISEINDLNSKTVEKIVELTNVFGDVVTIGNKKYGFGFLNSFIWDESTNNPVASIYDPLLCILEYDSLELEDTGEVRSVNITDSTIIELTPYLNETTSSNKFIYNNGNSFALFDKYIIYINGYSDAVNPASPTDKNLLISVFPKYLISVKTNMSNISIYTYNKNDLDSLLEDRSLLAQLNVLHHAKENVVKSVLKYLMNTSSDSIKKYELTRKETTKFELLYESHFSFTQDFSDGLSHNIYKNFVLCPKFFNNNNVVYYTSGEYILKLLVNNKWYYHKFNTAISDVALNLGELVYQYWDDDEMYSSDFAQLSYFNEENKEMMFNAYMHENKIVRVNNINYTKDVINMYNHENCIYIGMDEIPADLIIYYILVDNVKLYFSLNIYQTNANITIPDMSLINNSPEYSRYKEIILSDQSKCIIKIDNNIYKLNDLELNNSNSHVLYRADSYFYDSQNSEQKYYIHSIVNNINLFDKYKESINLPNNDKYLNQLVLFKLKKKVHKIVDILKMPNDLHMSLNGIMFQKEQYTNKIFISGCLFMRPGLSADQSRELAYIYKHNMSVSITDNADTYSIISNKFADNLNAVTFDNNNVPNASQFDAIQLYYDQSKQDSIFVFYIDENLNYTTSQYENDERELGYNIYTSIEEITNLFQPNDDYSTFEVITDNGKKTYEYIIKYDYIDKLNKIYVNINNLDYVLHPTYKYNNKDNTIFIKYNYTITKQNVPIYIYSNSETSRYIVRDVNSFMYNVTQDIDNPQYIPIVKVDYITSFDALTSFPIANNPTMIYMDGKQIFLQNSDPSVLYSKFESVKQQHEQYVRNTNMLETYFHSQTVKIEDTGETDTLFDLNDISNTDKLDEYIADVTDNELNVSYVNYLTVDILPLISSVYDMKIDYAVSSQAAGKITVIVIVKVTNTTTEEEKTYELTRGDIITKKYIIISGDKINIKDDENITFAHLYFKINNNMLINDDGQRIIISNDNTYWIKPALYYEYDIYEEIPYEEKWDPYNIINNINSIYNKWETIDIVQIANKKQQVFDLYSKFFECKYKLFDTTNKTISEYYDETLIDSTNTALVNMNKDSNYFGDNGTHNPNIHIANMINLSGSTWTFEKHIVESKPWCTLSINNMDYDLYLMHDLEKWYVTYISRQTLGQVLKYSDTVVNLDDFIEKASLTEMYSDDGEYKLEYETYNNQFLINRYKFMSSDGQNIFSKNSIICGVLSNDRLSVNLDISSKWHVSRPTLNKIINPAVDSKQEMTIISVNKDNEYKKGYYNVNVRYSLDGITNSQYVKKSIFRIE